MRKLLMLSAVAMLAFGTASTARAAAINYEGTMVLELGDLPGLTATGVGVAVVNGASTTIPSHLGNVKLEASRGGIKGTTMVLITDPSVSASIASIRVKATMRTGTLGPISGGAQSTTALTKGKLPIQGLAKVCLLSTNCTQFVPFPLTTAVSQRNGKFAGVGYGGLLVGTGGTPAAPIRISVEAAPWTIKLKTVIDEISTPMTPGGDHIFPPKTRRGFAHGTASATSNTAAVSGVVQLITPMQVRTNITSGSNSKIALFGTLTVHFIPEPGILLLLGSGVAGLVLLGRHRMRK